MTLSLGKRFNEPSKKVEANSPKRKPKVLVAPMNEPLRGLRNCRQDWAEILNPLPRAARTKRSFLTVSPGLRPGLFSSALFEGSLS